MSSGEGKPRKPRKSVPKALADSIKAKFRHGCAVSGDPYAEIHHIDGDPSNNVRENLIPLCPNCHHARAHGRAGHRLDAAALRLYRETGCRFAATGAYQLLLRYTAFLATGRYAEMDWQQLKTAYRDLESFVRGLRMGPHFADMLRRRIAPPLQPNRLKATIIGPGHSTRDQKREQDEEQHRYLSAHAAAYRAHLDTEREEVIALLDDILMAQDKPD